MRPEEPGKQRAQPAPLGLQQAWRGVRRGGDQPALTDENPLQEKGEIAFPLHYSPANAEWIEPPVDNPEGGGAASERPGSPRGRRHSKAIQMVQGRDRKGPCRRASPQVPGLEMGRTKVECGQETPRAARRTLPPRGRVGTLRQKLGMLRGPPTPRQAPGRGAQRPQ